MVLRKADDGDGDGTSAGAYIGGGSVLVLLGVVGIANDTGIGAVLVTIAGGSVLLVGLIMFAIAQSRG